MYTFDEFRADVFAAFEFLQSEYRMRRKDQAFGIEAWVEYESDLAIVMISYEIGARVQTFLEDPRYQRKPLDTTRRFSVSALAVNAQSVEAGGSRAAVIAQAATLQAHGDHVLHGDFNALHAQHDRLVAATLANRTLSNRGAK
jgi:hypothetical protein